MPGMLPYLRQLEQEREPPERRASFQFGLFVGEIPVYMELVHVAVDKSTGEIGHVTASRLRPEELMNIRLSPTLSEEEARTIYLQAVELELQWETDYGSEEPGRQYRLVYRVKDKMKGKSPRLIEAHSGAMILDK